MQVEAKYEGEEITAGFEAVKFRSDFGVPGSGFYDLDMDSIKLVYLEIAGTVIDLNTVPAPIANAIYELAGDLDFA